MRPQRVPVAEKGMEMQMVKWAVEVNEDRIVRGYP